MSYINNNISTNTNNILLFELADCYGTSAFAETFAKVYDKFRYGGASRLQWRALKNIFSDVFTEEDKDAWRSILTTMQKTCIRFPNGDAGVAFLWNGKIIADNGDYEGWVIED